MKSLWKTPCIKPDLLLKRRLEKWMPNYKWSQECSSIRRTYERYLTEKRIAEQQRYLRARRIAAAGKREKGKGKEDDIEGKKHNEAVGAGEKKREAKKGAVNNFDLIGEGEGKEGEGAADNSGPRSLRVTKKGNHKRAKNPEETPKKKMRVAGVGENM